MYHYAANNPVQYVDPDGNFIINNAVLGEKTTMFVLNANKNTLYLTGQFQPTIFSNSFDDVPGFPIYSLTERNIGFSNQLEDALLLAIKLKNDTPPQH